jgi:hypothetical protein
MRYDCVVISANYSSYDYDFINKQDRLIVDTKNAMKGSSGLYQKKIIKAYKAMSHRVLNEGYLEKRQKVMFEYNWFLFNKRSES